MRLINSKTMFHGLRILALLLVVKGPLFAESQKGCGRVAIVLGEVKNSVGERVSEGRKVVQGEQIVTGINAFAKLLLLDDSIVDIGPESRFVLKNCSSETGKNIDLALGLELGRVRVNVNKKTENLKRNFKIQSPTSVLAVRGTEFYLIWEKSGAGEIFENIALTEGTLEISTRFESSQAPIKLEAGNEFRGSGNVTSDKGSFKIDQFTATEQRLLEEQIKIEPKFEMELSKPILDSLLDPQKKLPIETKPLNLYQGAISQAQMGNYSVFSPVAGAVTGGGGGGGGSVGGGGGSVGGGGGGGPVGGPPPVFLGAGTIHFQDGGSR